jgi:D-alanyl-D-alanine dipeptidase
LKTGEAVTMPSGYDEMTERAHPDFKGGTPEQTRHRETLRKAMESEGFKVYQFEWWHFDYKDWQKYPITNLKFADLPASNHSPQ